MKITPNLKVEIPEITDAANTPHYLDSGFTAFDAAVSENKTTLTAHTSDLSLHVTTLEKTMITNALQKTGDTMTAPLIAGGVQDLAVKQVRNMTISAADPSGGSNGDMWFKYS